MKTRNNILRRNFKKSVQVLNWIAVQEGGKVDKLKAIKIYWLADRMHLRKYGSTITNDSYYAMTNGPVGSHSKDITSMSNHLNSSQKEYCEGYIEVISAKEYKSINDVDFGVLTESNIEVLEQVYDFSKHKNQFELVDMTHEYPEWLKFEQKLNAKPNSRFPIDIIDFFSNPKSEKFELFKEQTTEELLASMTYYKEFAT